VTKGCESSYNKGVYTMKFRIHNEERTEKKRKRKNNIFFKRKIYENV
jgi:hypothetical protein